MNRKMFPKIRIYIGFILFLLIILTLNTLLDYTFLLSKLGNYRRMSSEITIKDIVRCTDVELEKRVVQRGAFLVFENYILAEKRFKCGESITLTAPGDYRFLDNVEPLVERWKGPISIALYAPGYDFFTTLQSIAYLRNCATSLVRDLVTFHLFLENIFLPDTNVSLIDIYKDTYDCSLKPPYSISNDEFTFKAKHALTYPINVARNVAKLAAQTYFVFPSDIELYPTRNFIPKFFDFVTRQPEYFTENSKKVFVLPLFEVRADQQVPENRTQLYKMILKKTAILFHQNVCSPCHRIPQQDKWLNSTKTDSLGVFHVTKRQGSQIIWEPFFVCTQKEPLWDERLNWEGQGNKMCQAYVMCMLDYDFVVLDNAFLVQKPGIKRKATQIKKYRVKILINTKHLKSIRKEMLKIYGSNNECFLI